MSLSAFIAAGTTPLLAEVSSPSSEDYVDWVATGGCFLVGSLGPLLFGYDVGISQGALSSVMASPTISNEEELAALLPSASMGGAILVSFLILLSGNSLGRRHELLLAAVLYGASSLASKFAYTMPQLLLLRGLYGAAMGLSMHASAPFIAETCPCGVRGMLISLKEAVLVAGMLKGFLVVSTFAELPDGWRNIYVAAFPFSVFLGVGVWCLPESPRWLLLRDWQRMRASARAARAELSEASLGSSSDVSLRRLLSFGAACSSGGAGGGGGRRAANEDGGGGTDTASIASVGSSNSPPVLTIIDHAMYDEAPNLGSAAHLQQLLEHQLQQERLQLLAIQGQQQQQQGRSSTHATASSAWLAPTHAPVFDVGSSPSDSALSQQQQQRRSQQPQLPPRPSEAAARAALVRAWGRRATLYPELLDRELAGMSSSAKEASLYGVAPVRLLGHPLYYRPLVAGVMLMLFQQVTGQPVVTFESSEILSDAGVTQGQDTMVGAFRLLMTVIAAANVDIWGRRPLLLLGASGIVLSLVALAAAHWDAVASMAGPQAKAWVSVAAVLFYFACFQVSFGPVSWLYCGEIFPMAVRGPATAVANITGCSSSLFVQLILPYLHETFGGSGTYMTFAFVSLVAVLGVFFVVPETRGKTLEEIELEWGAGNPLPSSLETTSLSEWLL